MKYLSLFFLLVFFFFPARVLAETQSTAASPSAIATASPQIDYTLPYPGILPDNILYPLKMVRDAIVGFLISDPIKKAQFDLLQTDKRVNAARSLQKKGDQKHLVASTLSKAANYFEQALGEVKQAKREGQDVSHVVEQLHLANEKHQEVVRQIQSRLPERKQSTLSHILSRFESYHKQVNELMPAK